MVRFSVKPESFFRFFFNRSLGCLFNCEDHFHLNILINMGLGGLAINSSVLSSEETRELKQPRRQRLRKRHLKSEVTLPQTLYRLFHLVQFVKCWQFLLKLNSNRIQGKKKQVVAFCSRPPQNKKLDIFKL